MKNMRIRPEDIHKVPFKNTGSAIASGAVVDMGGRFGMAHTAIAATSGEGICFTAGGYDLAKATHATDKAFAVGEPVYWDATNSRCDKAGTSGAKYIGVCREAAASTATTVLVDINAPRESNEVKIVVDTTAAALNGADGQISIPTGRTVAPSYYQVQVYNASGRQQSGYDVDLATTPGTIIVKGLNGGVQLDNGWTAYVEWRS